jgi:osmotically-inducible protein OsmY
MNPDMELRHEVFEAMNWDPAISGADVDVRVENGVVTLAGQLPSVAMRHAVECAVQRVRGIKSLVNELTVRPVPEESRGESAGH